MSAIEYSPARYFSSPSAGRARRRACLFLRVALDRVGDGLFRGAQEVVHLAEHRADVAHLEHQPLQRHVFAPVPLRQESGAS